MITAEAEFLTPKQFATLRGVSTDTVYRWLKQRKLNAEQPYGPGGGGVGQRGGRWFIRREIQAQAGA